MTDATGGSPADRPVLSVVRGHPSDEELAAVLAVVSSLGRGAIDPPQRAAASGWSAYWRAARAPLLPGPGAWRASGRRH